MSDLEKQIIGDWVDIKNSLKDVYALFDYFKNTYADIDAMLRDLRMSVDEGVLEYKKSSLIKFFRFLDDAKFKSFDLEAVADKKKFLDELLFLVLLQRLICIGNIRLSRGSGGDASVDADDIEINTILKDTLARIKDDPELKKNLSLKNILVQFSIYHNEQETMKKLSPNIKAGSRSESSFNDNFKATFDRIFANIRKHYKAFLEEEANREKKENVLALLPLDKLGPQLFAQAKELTKLYSTMRFVLSEKYKSREILVHLSKRKDAVLKLVEEERVFFRSFAEKQNPGNPKAVFLEAVNALTREICVVLEKYRITV
jgi:hypothetical protein